MEEARARFEAKLQPQDNGCIVWTGCKTRRGYGQFVCNGKTYNTHRFAWLLAGRTIPDGFILRHRCKQNRACCNVEHLETGTHQDNSDDMIRDETRHKGEKVYGSKLTSDQVLEIRARANEFGKDLAVEFGVYPSCICKILNRKSWTHI